MLLPAIFYISWDIIFTSIHVWSFNPAYTAGIEIFNLPVEEILFFFIVPFCCTFIYECIRCYFPSLRDGIIAAAIFKILALILFITGIIFFKKLYTGTTFIFTALFILSIFLFRNYFSAFHKSAFLLTFLITLLPFLVVNGLLTSIPVVLYNAKENLNMHIYTIPVEDIFYGMLLVMMNIAGYERLKNTSPNKI